VSESCVFCEIAAGRASASFVFRDDRVSAFMDILPVTPGHLLVVPNRHATYLADLEPTDGAHMFQVAQQLAAALRRGLAVCEGVNLFYADGEAAGQEVFHAHLHVIPRFAGDGFGITRAPETLEEQPREELDRRADIIRTSLDID
jgi:histidine triad (HIT) family protein